MKSPLTVEKIASKFEVTCDYVIEEFVIDDEIHFPTLFAVDTKDDVFFFDFDDEYAETYED
jgi:hypothetical protein